MTDKRDERGERRGRRSRPERKERVIHTRVSQELDSELRERASGLGVSVSNLVRNVLLNTFGLVESVVQDGADVARAARGARAVRAQDRARVPVGVAPVDPFGRRTDGGAGGASGVRNSDTPASAGDAIIGWQALVLEINAVCARCNAILPRGSDAAIAIAASAAAAHQRPVICPRCVDAVRDDRDDADARDDSDDRQEPDPTHHRDPSSGAAQHDHDSRDDDWQ